MNYRHIYHAGNFADVFKHIILIMLLEALRKKEKGFLYLDTHAGIGRYDLMAEIAQKTREYENGIAKILQIKQCPPVVKVYQDIVISFNSSEDPLHYYPGSPQIAYSLLRKQDRMILAELHPEDVTTLKKEFLNKPNVAVHHVDGYQSLKAFLPPQAGRGLVLIDPPFEDKDEFQKVVSGLETALKRFPNGIYAIWYPIKEIKHVKNFYNKINELELEALLINEFSISKPQEGAGLTSCGMAIINPPWKFKEELQTVLEWLQKVMGPGLKS